MCRGGVDVVQSLKAASAANSSLTSRAHSGHSSKTVPTQPGVLASVIGTVGCERCSVRDDPSWSLEDDVLSVVRFSDIRNREGSDT